MKTRLLLSATVLAALAAAPLAYAEPADQPSQGSGPPPGARMMGGRGMMGGWGPGGAGDRGWMMGPGTMYGHGGRMMGFGMGGCMSGQWIDGQIAFLKAELKPTDAQTKEWDAFADAMRTHAAQMSGMHKEMRDSGDWSKLSPIERMEKHVALMETHLAAAKAMIEAEKPLYASLSDDQKKTFDSLMPACMGMM